MRNLTMLTDLYQLTMMYGYLKSGMRDNIATFDMFYRSKDQSTHYAIMAGLEQLIDYLKNLHFDEEAIEYLRGLGIFDEEFMQELRDFKFTGDVYAVPEGTIVFPGEPLVRVTAPIFEAQLVETALLNIINHQTLIATKASRVVQAAEGGTVMEFGLRRAQGPDAGIYGARAAIIGGCRSTSNVLTGQMYSIPIAGTHAHSWVMSFPDEITAFRKYAEMFPTSCLLLVDTYDTLKSGVPNAITVFNELRAAGAEVISINGQRLIATSEIRCAGPTLSVNNVRSAPPYEIRAIGDAATMENALKMRGGVVETLSVWGIQLEIQRSENVEVPAYKGTTQYQYAKPAGGEQS